MPKFISIKQETVDRSQTVAHSKEAPVLYRGKIPYLEKKIRINIPGGWQGKREKMGSCVFVCIGCVDSTFRRTKGKPSGCHHWLDSVLRLNFHPCQQVDACCLLTFHILLRGYVSVRFSLACMISEISTRWSYLQSILTREALITTLAWKWLYSKMNPFMPLQVVISIKALWTLITFEWTIHWCCTWLRAVCMLHLCSVSTVKNWLLMETRRTIIRRHMSGTLYSLHGIWSVKPRHWLWDWWYSTRRCCGWEWARNRWWSSTILREMTRLRCHWLIVTWSWRQLLLLHIWILSSYRRM